MNVKTRKIKHHNALRGPRYRKARRAMKRGYEFATGTRVLCGALKIDSYNEFGVPAATSMPIIVVDKPLDLYEESKIDRYICPTCGAKNDERCRTLTAGKVTDRHAKREAV